MQHRTEERRPRPDVQPSRKTMGLNDPHTGEVFAALQSGTARSVFLCLLERPRTVSEVAADTDEGLQTVQYHLEKLVGSGLVTTVGTRLSEKGREMDLYAPAEVPVIVGGSSKEVDWLEHV